MYWNEQKLMDGRYGPQVHPIQLENQGPEHEQATPRKAKRKRDED